MSSRQTFVAARVWDGLAERSFDQGFVRVADGCIAAVGRASELASDADVRDIGDVTLMPGLINAHVHVTFSASQTLIDDYFRERESGVETLTERAEDNLRKAIGAGVTTVRDLGTLNEVVFRARTHVRDGAILGPDVVAAGEGITSKGGHCHFFSIEAEGVDDLRAAVRRQHDAGADVIKVFATGGNLTPGSDPLACQYEEVELRAVVDEAHRLGLPVAAHAHTSEGIRRSVSAGADTIEHCNFGTADGVEFDEAVAIQMRDRGIIAAPTPGVSVFELLADPSRIDQMPAERQAKVRRILARVPETFAVLRRLHEVGVTIVAGSDAGIPSRPFDSFPADLSTLANEVGAGFGARAALEMATSTSARALGLADRGTLEPRKRADLLAVGGDPLARIEDLQDTRFVMCGGLVAVDKAS